MIYTSFSECYKALCIRGLVIHHDLYKITSLLASENQFINTKK
jgi:hypothetical protein